MRGRHVPDDEFVQRLELTLEHEVRRRNSRTVARAWWPRWPLRPVIAAVALVAVSMAIGGAVVARAYQAQDNERRNALVANLRLRAEAAATRIELARTELQSAQRQRDIGIGSEDAVLDAQLKVREGEALLRAVQLDMEEVRLTTREPLNAVSAPLVSGRDFVSERLRTAMTVPAATLERERARLKNAQQRVEVGLAEPLDLQLAQARVVENEAGLAAFQRKLEIRLRFLRGDYDAAMADLRLMEAEAEERLKAAQPRLQSARQTAQRVAVQVEIGRATPLQLTEAQLTVKEREVELERLKLDLLLVQKQIADRQSK